MSNNFENIFTLGTFTVNYPKVNNSNVSQNNIITQNGQFNVPEGKTGFNSFEVDVEQEINNVDNDTTYSTENNALELTSTSPTNIQPAPGKSGLSNVYVKPKNKTLSTIRVNGNYDIPEGFSGINAIQVDVPTTLELQQKTLNVNGKIGQTITVLPDQGKNGLSEVTVNVTAPTIQSKSITINANGSQNIQPDNGYDYLSSVNVTTNVPSTPSQDTRIRIGANFLIDKYTVIDDDNYSVERGYGIGGSWEYDDGAITYTLNQGHSLLLFAVYEYNNNFYLCSKYFYNNNAYDVIVGIEVMDPFYYWLEDNVGDEYSSGSSTGFNSWRFHTTEVDSPSLLTDRKPIEKEQWNITELNGKKYHWTTLGSLSIAFKFNKTQFKILY